MLRRRGPLRPPLEHPTVVDLPLLEPEEIRTIDSPTEAPIPTARANGLGSPEDRGAFEPRESPDRGATPSSRDATNSEEMFSLAKKELGTPSRLFHRPPRPTLTGRPERRAVTPTSREACDPHDRQCDTALLRFSTNQSLAGRCAANFRGLLMLQVAILSNNKIAADAIFLSTASATGNPQAGPRPHSARYNLPNSRRFWRLFNPAGQG